MYKTSMVTSDEHEIKRFPYDHEPDITNRKEVLDNIRTWVEDLPEGMVINLCTCPNWTIPYFKTILIKYQKQRMKFQSSIIV